MSDKTYPDAALKLDPWAASSLLQKAIRRGEAVLAQQAVASLRKYRGEGVWRRLASIALEDVGIADPDLVWQAVQLATVPETRMSRSPEVLHDLVIKFAVAPKDRCADYLFSAAMKLRTAREDRLAFDALSFDERLSIAAGPLEPVVRRAVAALSECTVVKNGGTIVDSEAATRFASEFDNAPLALLNSMLALTGGRNSHPFGLMLVLLRSHYEFVGGSLGTTRPAVPATERVDGIPLYTYDKHTAVGKRAIAMMIDQNPAVRATLSEHVPPAHWRAVAAMAAYYADAAPVSHRLEWPLGPLMSLVGFNADMIGAGCSMTAAPAVLECVEQNLAHLNDCRRAALRRQRRVKCN